MYLTAAVSSSRLLRRNYMRTDSMSPAQSHEEAISFVWRSHCFDRHPLISRTKDVRLRNGSRPPVRQVTRWTGATDSVLRAWPEDRSQEIGAWPEGAAEIARRCRGRPTAGLCTSTSNIPDPIFGSAPFQSSPLATVLKDFLAKGIYVFSPCGSRVNRL